MSSNYAHLTKKEKYELLTKDFLDRDGDRFVRIRTKDRLGWEDTLPEDSAYSAAILSPKTDRELYNNAVSLARQMITSMDPPFKVNVRVDPTRSCTDSRDVYVATKVFDDERLTLGQKLDTFLGLTVHEGSHLLYTDFKALEKNKNYLIHQLQNIFEDERIERELGEQKPGLANFLKATKYYYFGLYTEQLDEKAGQLPKAARLFNAILSIVRYPASLSPKDAMEFADELLQTRDILTPYPDSTKKCIECAKKVYDILKRFMEEDKGRQQKKSQQRSSSQQSQDSDSSDSDKQQPSSSGQDNKENNSDTSKSDDTEKEKDRKTQKNRPSKDNTDKGEDRSAGNGATSDSFRDDVDKRDKKEANKGKSLDRSKNNSDNEDEKKDSEESGDSKDNESKDDNISVDGNDVSDKKPESEESGTEEKESKDKQSSGSTEEESNDSPEDEKHNRKDSGSTKEESRERDNSEEEVADNQSKTSDESDDESDADDEDTETDTEGSVECHSPEGEDDELDNEDTESVPMNDEEVLSALSGIIEAVKQLTQDPKNPEDNSNPLNKHDVAKALLQNESILAKESEGELEIGSRPDMLIVKQAPNRYRYETSLRRVKRYIPAVRQALRAKGTEYQYSVTGMRSGLLDTNKLSEARQGVQNVYIHKGEVKSDKIDVVLLIDESGSMEGIREQLARDTAVLINESIGGLQNVGLSIYGYTRGYEGSAIFPYREGNTPFDRYTIGAITSRGGTPTAASMLEAATRLRKRTRNKTLMFIISDGMADTGTTDVRKATDQLKKDGIQVVGISISSSLGEDSLKQMYDHWIVMNNLDNLASGLGKTVKKAILKNTKRSAA